MVRGLQSEAWRQHVEQGLVVREQRSVRQGYANAELDVEAVAEVDVAQITALSGQPVGLGDLLACGQEIPAQTVAKSWGQVTRRRLVSVWLEDDRVFLFGFFTSTPLPCRPCRGRCPFLGRSRSERAPGPAGFE